MKSRICYINDIIFSGSSGELTHTVGLLNAWANQGNKVTYITYRKNKKILSNYNISTKINFIWLQCGNTKVFNRLYFYFYFYFYLNKHEFDIFYIRETFYTLLLLPFIFKYKCKKRYLEFNGLRSKEETNFVKSLLITITDYLNKIIYKNVNINITVSRGIEECIKDQFSISNVITINNATDLNYYSGDVRKKNSLIFIGNLSSWQNFYLLIETVKRNYERLEKLNVTIDIYGKGSEEANILKKINELKVSNLIFLHDKVDKCEIPKLLKSSSLGLLIDKRYYKGYLLFSPLKYYEYCSAHIETILLVNNKSIINEKLDNVYICDPDSFISTIESRLSINNNVLNLNRRTWDDVVLEIEKKVFSIDNAK